MKPEPRVIKAANAAEFLRMVPELTGIDPVDSLVLVAFTNRRTAGAMRVDLPFGLADVERRRWAVSVVGMLCRVDDLTGVVPIAYTSERFETTGRPPQAALLRAVSTQAKRSGLEVKDLVSVAADAWGSLLDPALPRGGRPLAEIAPVEPRGPMRLGAVPEIPRFDDAARALFAERMEQWDTRSNGPGGMVHGFDLGSPRLAFGRAARRESAVIRLVLGDGFAVLAEGMLEPHADAECPCLPLLALLAEWTTVQEAMLLRFGWGGEFADALMASVIADHRLTVDHPAAVALWGGPVRRPDVDRLRTAITVVLGAAGHLPADERGPLLAMAAWLHWALGGGTVAGRLAESALAASPDERLGTAVLSLVDAGQLPEWAFNADPLADPLRELA